VIEILAANAKTEQLGHPVADSVEAARKGGAFALGTPAAYGGKAPSVSEVATLLTRMGRACPSTSWIAGTCLSAKTLVAGPIAYGEAARATAFADPDALFCGTGRPEGRGEPTPAGIRVTGRWNIISGCEDADWASVALMVDGTFSSALMPMADLCIEQTWDVAGMRGTGSHTVIADGVLVDPALVAAFTPPGLADRQLFGITVLAPVVGATFGALDVIDAMFASDRKPFMTSYASMGESPGARQWLAEATFLAQRAERAMLAVAAEVDGDGDLDERDGSRLHLELCEAARDCRLALDRMLDLHGASGFRMSNPLQRLWRDVAVGSRHPHLGGYLAVEDYGQKLSSR
jgi:alkylation response protein AidB-like acyl-CoA dehydrogenase